MSIKELADILTLIEEFRRLDAIDVSLLTADELAELNRIANMNIDFTEDI